VQIRVEAEWWWREKRFAGEKNMRFGGNESVKKGLKEGKSVLSCRVKKEGKKEKKIERERKNTMKIKVLRNSISYLNSIQMQAHVRESLLSCPSLTTLLPHHDFKILFSYQN
jgi:hypothetical protein